jgi:hypothetical protein
LLTIVAILPVSAQQALDAYSPLGITQKALVSFSFTPSSPLCSDDVVFARRSAIPDDVLCMMGDYGIWMGTSKVNMFANMFGMSVQSSVMGPTDRN